VSIEAKRQCGWRKVGAMYLVGSGMALPCDLLPLPITPCPTCHFTIPFTRGFLWVHRDYLYYRSEGHYYSEPGCKCGHLCPICYPLENIEDQAMLMWVGEKFYSPSSFIREAQEMGVSKRIAEIPKGLKLGRTWVLLAHRKVPFYYETVDPLRVEKQKQPAIFYAFKPTKIEKLIWQSQATPERLEELRQKGITPVIVPDNEKEHT